MINDKNIEVKKEYRLKYPDSFYLTGRWFYILSINNDDTINICSKNHMIMENVSVDDIKLKS